MLKIALATALLALSACKNHHDHELQPNWLMDITVGESGATKTLPVLMDDFVSAIDYSQVNFHAEAPVMKGDIMTRAFSLYGQGEQKVRTEVKCDTSKSNVQGSAGEAELSLLGTTVKFSCNF